MTREEKERMQDVFLKRLNRLEMYGNILTKGHDTSKDIGEAVSAVDNEAVSGIIRKILSRYGVFPILPIYTFGETPEDKKKDFVEIVTAFRNYFVHPFRDGKKKHLLPKGLKNFLQQHRLDRWQILKKQ